MSWDKGDSSCWRTGATFRRAKMSPGSRSTGRRLMVAPAAAVTMFVGPGPMELVAGQVVAELRVLLERLAEPSDDSVAEDAPDAGEERGLPPVTLHVLLREEANQRLRRREPLGPGGVHATAARPGAPPAARGPRGELPARSATPLVLRAGSAPVVCPPRGR